jgi:hypothetical protein
MSECEILVAWSIIGFLITDIILRVDYNLRYIAIKRHWTISNNWTIRDVIKMKFLTSKLAVLLLIFAGPLVWASILNEMLIDSIFSNLD